MINLIINQLCVKCKVLKMLIRIVLKLQLKNDIDNFDKFF